MSYYCLESLILPSSAQFAYVCAHLSKLRFSVVFQKYSTTISFYCDNKASNFIMTQEPYQNWRMHQRELRFSMG